MKIHQERIDAEADNGAPKDRRRGTVVLVIDALGRGGAERLLALYAPELRDLGYNVRVVALQVRDGNPEAAKLQALGIPVDHIELRKIRNLRQLMRVTRAVREMRPSVIHAHLEAATLVGGILRVVLAVPAVATLHTLEHPSGLNRASLRLWVMGRILSNLYDRVIVLSDAIAREARIHGLQRAPLVTLSNGIPPPVDAWNAAEVRGRLRAELGILDDALVIVTVAVLRPPKGVDKLIAAMTEVLRSFPSARLLIVGDGSERQRLEQQTRDAGIGHAVVFAGFRDDVFDLLKASDVFVLPTLLDALPTVVIEAMFASLPIIASRVGGLPDMLDDGVEGELVPPGDVQALATSILKMLKESERREAAGAAALRRAQTCYSLPSQVRKLADLYDDVAAGKGLQNENLHR
jgi:glycosyltransferase involved in cell wall biosynthesis